MRRELLHGLQEFEEFQSLFPNFEVPLDLERAGEIVLPIPAPLSNGPATIGKRLAGDEVNLL